MFAYCRDNPVNRKDAQGTEDICCTTNDDDGNPLNDFGPVRGGGGSAGGNSSYASGNGGSGYGGAAGTGFSSFGQLKNTIGSPGTGNQWHHIVEQSQITKSGFDPQMIHNTDNIIALDKATHQAISGYYSSKQPFTNGITVRNWLAGQSFGEQYRFGMEVIRVYM